MYRQEFMREFELETSDDPPDPELAQPIIDKYYVRKMVEVNGEKTFSPFTMGDSIEEYQKLGEGTYMYFCFLKFFGFVFMFLGLLMLVPVVLMILEENNSNESKTNIFLRTMTANIKALQKLEDGSDGGKEHINKVFTIFLWFFFSINVLIFLSIVIFRVIVKRKRIQLSRRFNFRNEEPHNQGIHFRNPRTAQ